MTAPQMVARKSLELRLKLAAFDKELERWTEASRAADGHLRTHCSQIRGIVASLSGLREAVGREVDAAADQLRVIEAAANLQRLILTLYRIWEVFRAKFEQRSVPAFRNYLASADELVWSCYGTIRDAAPAAVGMPRGKEPPLVFLNGGWSPFVLPRDAAFQAEDVARERISGGAPIRTILQRQPISVIGVPWYQIAHLPEALVLLHEAGHVVEADFQLSQQLHGLLSEALRASSGTARHAHWAAWLPEVFADLFGCLTGGPAFVDTLMDFLVGPHDSVIAEQSRETDAYPSATLRVLLAADALDVLGFPRDAERLRTRWTELYPEHAMREFMPDLATIAHSLINGCAIGAHKLRELPNLAFTSDHQLKAAWGLGRLKRGEALMLQDVRALFVTARIAFQDDPAAYADRGWNARLLNELAQYVSNSAGLRARRSAPQALDEATDEDWREHGRTMIDDLRAVAGVTSA